MYTIRAIWEGELLGSQTMFSETLAYKTFDNMIVANADNSGVSIQLFDDQNNVLSEYYIP